MHNGHRHRSWSPHEETHRESEALARDGLLERIIKSDGRIEYRAMSHKAS